MSVQTLVVHINREHLIQESAETYIEMATPFGVSTVIFVVAEGWEDRLKNCLRNIRPGEVKVEIVPTFSPKGIVAVMDEYDGILLEDAKHTFKPNTLIVGPDKGEFPHYEGTKVSIPVLTSCNLWSWHAAAIGLYEFNRELISADL